MRDDVDWLRRETANRHNLPVVFEGAGERLTLTVSDLERWYGAYQLPFVDRSVALDEPADGDGLVMRVRFGPPIGGFGQEGRSGRRRLDAGPSLR